MGRSGILNKSALFALFVGTLMVCAGAAVFAAETWTWVTQHRWEPLTATMVLERYAGLTFWGSSSLPSERLLYWLRNLPLERLLIGGGLVLSMFGTLRRH